MRTVTLVALGWLVSLVVVIAACSAPPKKTAADMPTGSAGEKCCCKSTPITADDGKPVFENINRMDCSTKQGDCVSDVQCNTNSQ